MNIRMISKPNPKLAYSIIGSNQSVEKIAYKAIEKIYGTKKADELVQYYNRAPITKQSVTDDFGKFDNPYIPRCTLKEYEESLSELLNIFQGKKLLPVHFCDTPYYPWNLSAALGEPYCIDKHLENLVETSFQEGKLETRKLNKNTAINYVLQKTRITVHNIKDGKLKKVPDSWITRVLARSHLSIPDKIKVRAVYCVCFSILMIECMFLWPIIAFLKESTLSPLLWGYETTRGGSKRLFLESSDGEIYLLIDWNSFDKYLPFWLIVDIMQTLKKLFNFAKYMPSALKPEYIESIGNIERLSRLFDFIIKFYTESHIRTPDGALWQLNFAGLLSGCFGTQLIGSLANYIIISTILKSLKINYKEIKVLGDDSFTRILFGYKLTPLLEQLLLQTIERQALLLFGLILSLTKSKITSDPTKIIVLSYGYDGMTYREKDDLLGKLLYPERRITVESTKSRAIGIAIANFGRDPDIYRVCKDIYYHLHQVKIPHDLYLTWFDEEILQVRKYLESDTFPTYEETFLSGCCIQETKPDLAFRRAFITECPPPVRSRGVITP